MKEQDMIGKKLGLSERGRKYAIDSRTPDGDVMSEYFAQQLLDEETWPVTYKGKTTTSYMIFVTAKGDIWHLKNLEYFEPWKYDIDVQTFKDLIGGK